MILVLVVDYLKFDWCNTKGINAKEAYTTMSMALQTAGRPIVFSLCEWGDNKPWEWGSQVGELWRTTGDITNCFDCEKKHNGYSEWGVMRIVDKQEGLAKYAGPGHWNDPDMLEAATECSRTRTKLIFPFGVCSQPLLSPETIYGRCQFKRRHY